MEMTLHKGTSIIFLNSEHKVLLILRDNIPEIAYPNMWDLPGGGIEGDETPEQTIIREMKEEMDLDLKEFSLFSVTEFVDRLEYTFWKKINLNIEETKLNEGQILKWFSEKEIRMIELAFNFNTIIENFYKKRPFLS